LQLVIMAQTELLPRIKRIRNFMDRVALKYTINPLDEAETKGMIEFRLRQAGFCTHKSLFTDEAVRLVYRYSQGYPRRIAMLCHDALETAVMQEYSIVDDRIINVLTQQESAYA
jgi:general secretion pathway protein A